MAHVTVRETGEKIQGQKEIGQFLASYGIWHERWDVDGRLAQGADSGQILAVYEPEIQALKAKAGYVTADVINVTSATPGLEAMLAKFRKEHTHDEDEVRFIIRGRGVFHIRPADDRVFAIQVEEGDLINVPAGTRHWFDLCEERAVQAIRLFKDASGWTPRYTQSDADLSHPPICWGPAWVSNGERIENKVRL